MRRGDLLSVPEIAAVAHLPADDVVPGLARAGARPVPPPPQVPAAPARPAAASRDGTARAAARPVHTVPGSPAVSFPGTPGRAGPNSSGAVKPLGDSDAGVSAPVGISVPDARHHLHVIGATGSGKSTLMVNMILADIEAGRGVAVVDPKGDMITDLLARIPAEAAGRVALLDPDDNGPVPSLNVLDGPVPELAAEHLVSIFRTIYADTWGPRTDDIFRAAVLTLLTVAPPGPDGRLGPAPRWPTCPGCSPMSSSAAATPPSCAPQGQGPGRQRPVRVLVLVRRAVRRRPRPGHRPADEQAAGVPAAHLPPRGDRRRAVHR